jgi:transmembrane sensor
MKTEQASALLEKYRQGTLSEEEKTILDSWYLQLSREGSVDIDDEEIQYRLDAVWGELAVNRKIKRKAVRLRILSISAAAVILIAVGIGLYGSLAKNDIKAIAIVQDIPPGGDKAVLVLADGREISLSDARNGKLAQQSGVVVSKVADGKLSYSGTDGVGSSQTNSPIYNVIRTPRGGKFQVELPDGTIVWLNAASSIKYPVQFTGNERRVELTGEGYFEVVKEKNMPFIVQCRDQEITVLGTHFTINSYSDEPFTKTSLIEGSVRVVPLHLSWSQGKVIKPGEQTLLNANEFLVQQADLEKEMAWKHGDFIFNNEDFDEILRQISRWYDVEMVSKGNYSDLKLSGRVSRSRSILAVLGALEETAKVKFQIEGRRIMVKD